VGVQGFTLTDKENPKHFDLSCDWESLPQEASSISTLSAAITFIHEFLANAETQTQTINCSDPLFFLEKAHASFIRMGVIE